MRPDVIDLREFYHARLGQVARVIVRRRLHEVWPDVTGLRVLGLGYATPFLRPYVERAERVLALMPAAQGVIRWPTEGGSLTALADELDLPLPDASVDRALLVHELENVEQAQRFLREIWRVLTSDGRLIVVVPNRRGIWARREGTPFGYGRPYSQRQLSALLRETMFQPRERAGALWAPPFNSRLLLRTAPAWERLGALLAPQFAGLLIQEADKQIYAAPALRELKPARRAIPAGATPASA
jgi:SAM-dependent methyltransferase